jgi:hypothetical protein
MKITKSRLLQIIREEVELHEKKIEDLDAASTQEPVSTDKDGNVKNPKDILDQAAAGELEEETTEEDQILDPKNKKVIEPPKKREKIEIKIR